MARCPRGPPRWGVGPSSSGCCSGGATPAPPRGRGKPRRTQLLRGVSLQEPVEDRIRPVVGDPQFHPRSWTPLHQIGGGGASPRSPPAPPGGGQLPHLVLSQIPQGGSPGGSRRRATCSIPGGARSCFPVPRGNGPPGLRTGRRGSWPGSAPPGSPSGAGDVRFAARRSRPFHGPRDLDGSVPPPRWLQRPPDTRRCVAGLSWLPAGGGD